MNGVSSAAGPTTDWRGDPARLCHSIVDQTIVGVVQLDAEGRMVFVNREWCRMLGRDEHELLGQDFVDLVEPACAPASREALAAMRAGGPPAVIENRYRCKDGGALDACTCLNALCDTRGRQVGLTAVIVDMTAKVHAEAELQRTARRYRELFESIDDGFCVIEMLFDAEGQPCDYRFLETNPAFARETGLGDAVGRRMRELAPTHERHWYEIYGEVATSGRPVRFMQHAAALGDRWFDVYAYRVDDPDEHHVAIIFRDVSERVQAESALLESEARLRHLADAAPAILWSADPQGRVRYMSERWFQFSGLAPEQAGRVTIERVHPDDRERVRAAWRHAIAQGEPYEIEMRLRRRDGAWRWFLVRAIPRRDAHGRVAAWHGSSTDIDDRKVIEEALRLSEQRMALAIDVAQVGVWTWEMSTDEVQADCLCRELWNAPPSGPLYQSQIVERVHPDDWPRVQRLLQSALSPSGSGKYGVEFRWLHADGSLRWAHSRGQALFEGTGAARRPVRMLGTAVDITARRAIEEALREANQRKDEFLATLAHELRNPLAPLRNSLHLLRMGVGEEHREQLQGVMERQVTQLGRLVDDLLEVSRITRGKVTLHPEPVVLDEVVQRAVETSQPLIDAAHHALTIELPQPPLLLQADPMRLAQVLANLLNNAAKYTEPGGRIAVRGHREGDVLVLRVRDNGLGISAEQLPYVFDLFAQADRSLSRAQGGLGIGLTLARTLVELHGGSVQARSGGSGQGSEFEVRLPLRPPQTMFPQANAAAVEAGEAHRLLVVDDNREHADTLALYLRMVGQEVLVARDGQEALDAVAGFDPEAVLMDIGMPGIDGYEAARRMRAQPGGSARVLVALTGWGQGEDRRRSRAAGFDAHLVKPTDPVALLALVDSLLRAKRGSPP